MKRGFTLLELTLVIVVAGILAATGMAVASSRMRVAREQDLAETYLLELRAVRLDFVNNGAVSLRVLPIPGGAELRSVTGSCADEAAGLPTSTLDRLTRSSLPLLNAFCVDRYGRATDAQGTPINVSVGFSTTPVRVHWDSNGRIYMTSPAEDAPARPRLDNLASINTKDPTPGTQPIGAAVLPAGVLR